MNTSMNTFLIADPLRCHVIRNAINLMKPKQIYLIIIFYISTILSGCGTTHHFVPPRPLENKEYLISVNWHFDFGKNIRPLIAPEVSLYTGIDDKNTIGFGYHFPIFLSHISHIRYFEDDFNKYWNLSSHLNKPFGLNNNPILEIEFSFASKGNNYWQMISAGISLRNRDDIPLFLYLDNGFTENKHLLKGISLLPAFKYQIGGNDLALSYIHYHGLTRASLKNIKKEIEISNETIIEIRNNLILRIEKKSQWGYPLDIYEIYLTNGDTIKLYSPYRHGDQMNYSPTYNNYLSQIGFVDYKVHIYTATGDNEIGETTLRIEDLINSEAYQSVLHREIQKHPYQTV